MRSVGWAWHRVRRKHGAFWSSGVFRLRVSEVLWIFEVAFFTKRISFVADRQYDIKRYV